MSYLRYLCLFANNGVQTYCIVFLFLFVFCFVFLHLVGHVLSLRYSIMFIVQMQNAIRQ